MLKYLEKEIKIKRAAQNARSNSSDLMQENRKNASKTVQSKHQSAGKEHIIRKYISRYGHEGSSKKNIQDNVEGAYAKMSSPDSNKPADRLSMEMGSLPSVNRVN